ncbi:MAG: LptA/OstA family protein, partial [Bryobacteraceae bacterium]
GEVRRVTGETNARLVSHQPQSRTTMTTDRIDLEFASAPGGAELRKALANGRSAVESQPMAGSPPPPARVLRSEVIEMSMRDGGAEIDSVSTHAAGEIEFVPSHPSQRHRRMTGERMWIQYGPRNAIRTFRAVGVDTTTGPATPKGAPARTSSKNLLAHFHAESGEMTRLEQWDDFRYAEGDRKATASRAELDSAANRITLDTAARVWDPAGSTSADKILIEQSSGDYIAEGRVTSSRAPEKKSGLLPGDDPVQAVAPRMTTTRGHALIRYEGGAVLWQGGNRIRAATIDIDREERRLIASGNVETQLVDRRTKARTVTTAAGLIYTESDRQAHYSGGVVM